MLKVTKEYAANVGDLRISHVLGNKDIIMVSVFGCATIYKSELDELIKKLQELRQVIKDEG